MDDFSDNDITSGVVWQGNTENFSASSGSLELNDLDVLLTQSLIQTDVPLTLGEIEWRFYIDLGFSGSDNNNARVYLTADGVLQNYTATASAGVNGYFLKFGEGGSTDVIRLYRDDAGSITLLASGTTSIAASFSCRVKVTRSITGNWSVYTDFSGGENFLPELTAADNTLSSSVALGLGCTYTSSNFNNFLFDDFYAGPPVQDLIPPNILEANTVSASAADILFSEPLEMVSAETISNYNLPGIVIDSALQDEFNPALVHIYFQSPLSMNQIYLLTVSGVSDLNGNIMPAAAVELFYVIITPPDFRSVRINEILADPNPVIAMPDAEFVELFNATDSIYYNLQGWIFVNSETEKILPSFVLGPGEYVILCDASNTSLFTGFGNVVGISSFTALTNTGDSLTLKDTDGNIVDYVTYSYDWYTTSAAAGGGVSLELVNPYSSCVGSVGWLQSESAAGGTPGTENSVFNIAPDLTAPVVSGALISISGSEVTIIFSEPIDTASVQTNSFVPNGNFFSALEWNAAFNSVTMTLFQALNTPASIQIFLQGLADCAGNAIADTSVLVELGLQAIAGDIVINEILADPSPVIGLPNAEFFELRNNTAMPLDLTSLRFNGSPILGAQIIPANGFLVVTDDANISLFDGIDVAYVTALSLTNSTDEIILTNADDEILDQLVYSIEWYNDPVKDDGGWSLERINPALSCSGRNDWRASINESGGTAGFENSVFSNTTPVAPAVVASGAADSSAVYIIFNQSMDTTSGWQPPITLPSGDVITNKYWSTDLNKVILRFAEEFTPGISHPLAVNAYMNCVGMGVDTSLLYFTIGFDPQPGDVIINEIMADAVGTNQMAFPAVDFIEIFNRSGHLIELTHLTINDGFFNEQVTLAPDSFLVIGDILDLDEFIGIASFAAMEEFPSLYEDGLRVELVYRGDLIDAVEYNKSFYKEATAESGGQSMERINPYDPCDAPDNWSACNHPAGTTAGIKNSVFNNSMDDSPPVFQSIIYDGDNFLTMVFSEPVSTDSAEVVATVNGLPVSTELIVISGLYGNELLIPLGSVNIGEQFEVIIQGVADCWGNISPKLQSTFSIPDSIYNSGDLIINEILYNPRAGGYDFVEVYNPGSATVSIAGWSIADATNGSMNSPDVLTDRGYVVLPGEYAVFTRNGASLPQYYPATRIARVLNVDGFPDFSSDDEVFLLTPNGDVSDHLDYDDAMHFDLLNSTDGVSLERVSAKLPAANRENWNSASASVNYATPGYLNSQDAEVGGNGTFAADPNIFSPDNDGYQDNLIFSYSLEEAGYVGNVRIYNDVGQEVRHLVNSELLGQVGNFLWDGLSELGSELPVGMYVAMLETFSLSGEVKTYRAVCVLAAKLN